MTDRKNSKYDDWDEWNAKQCQDRFALTKQAQLLEDRLTRTQLTLDERIQNVVANLWRINIEFLNSQTRSTSIVEFSAASAESYQPDNAGSNVRAAIGELESDEVWKYLSDLSDPNEKVKWGAVLTLEKALEEQFGSRQFEANKTEDELVERLLSEFEGRSPEEALTLEPALGTTKAIRYMRYKHERDSETGKVFSQSTSKRSVVSPS